MVALRCGVTEARRESFLCCLPWTGLTRTPLHLQAPAYRSGVPIVLIFPVLFSDLKRGNAYEPDENPAAGSNAVRATTGYHRPACPCLPLGRDLAAASGLVNPTPHPERVCFANSSVPMMTAAVPATTGAPGSDASVLERATVTMFTGIQVVRPFEDLFTAFSGGCTGQYPGTMATLSTPQEENEKANYWYCMSCSFRQETS